MYIDTDIAERRGLFQKVKIYLNGKLVNNATSAKSGKNGFVEFFDQHPKLNSAKDEIIHHKKRGLVKLSFNL